MVLTLPGWGPGLGGLLRGGVQTKATPSGRGLGQTPRTGVTLPITHNLIEYRRNLGSGTWLEGLGLWGLDFVLSP